ncbi:hypothetical protein ACLOJK_039562 [Asimina triloba]
MAQSNGLDPSTDDGEVVASLFLNITHPAVISYVPQPRQRQALDRMIQATHHNGDDEPVIKPMIPHVADGRRSAPAASCDGTATYLPCLSLASSVDGSSAARVDDPFKSAARWHVGGTLAAAAWHIASGTTPTTDACIDHVVIASFSSLGSLDEKWMAELASSMSSGLLEDKTPLGLGKAMIVWPTVEDVRCSLEGYAAGSAIPSSEKNVEKDFLKKYWARWKANHTGRGWFILTSANLSKAAWGALQKNNSQLMIRSYEVYFRDKMRWYKRWGKNLGNDEGNLKTSEALKLLSRNLLYLVLGGGFC